MENGCLKKLDIGFVVLHYLDIEETVECVSSIRRMVDTDRYHIVVVDNASSNGSGDLLKERYFGQGDVTIILNSTNVGVARGNNV